MDPLSVTAAILACVQVANSTAKLFAAIYNAGKNVADAKYDELEWRLFAEKETMEGLLRLIEFTGKPIPPEYKARFLKLVQGLDSHFSEIQNALRGLLPTSGAQLSRTSLKIAFQRIKFEEAGFARMKQQLDAIEAMNRALKIMGQTLPDYDESSSEPGPNASGPRGAGESSEPHQGSTMTDRQQATARHAEVVADREQTSSRTPISSLCQLCLTALNDLSAVRELKETRILDIYGRLELWAKGLLGTGPLALDEIFEADPDRHAILKTYCVRSLVNIAVAEGKEPFSPPPLAPFLLLLQPLTPELLEYNYLGSIKTACTVV